MQNRAKSKFIIGDIHGCHYSLLELLQQWDASQERLCLLGDLISKGKHSLEVVQWAKKMEQSGALVLRGNHEQQLGQQYLAGRASQHWAEAFFDTIEAQYAAEGLDFMADVAWLAQRPTYYEEEFSFLSHAGLGYGPHAWDPMHPQGILWHRGPLKPLGKLQFLGHTPQKAVLYRPKEGYCNLDTGASLGNLLSAARVDEEGNILEFISVATDPRDLA